MSTAPEPGDARRPGHHLPSRASRYGAVTQLRVEYPADTAVPSLVRHRMREWLADLRWPDQAAFDIVLAVDEAVSNAVEHAYRPGAPGQVTVAAKVWSDRRGRSHVRLVVQDHGRWVGQLGGGPPSGRGNGLRIMTVCMAAVILDTTATGTTVTMTSRSVERAGTGLRHGRVSRLRP